MNPLDVINACYPDLAPPPNITGSEWADEFRVVTGGPSPGRWQTSKTPDLKEILDCVTDRKVEGIVIMKPTRSGGTEVVCNAMGYYTHYDPCKILYAQSSKEQGLIFSDSILMQMLRDTPVLSDLMVHEHGRKATHTKDKKFFINGGDIRIIGAKSPKGFQAIEARVVIGDDLDEWEVSKHGDPVLKLIDRAKGIHNKKVILVSFPTHELTSRIYHYYKLTDMRERWVPCLRCGAWQVLRFGNSKTDYGLKWHKSGDVWYECEHCQGRTEEYEKDEINTLGEWRAEAEFNGWAGFKINPFLRSWHRWAEIKDAFLACGKDVYKLMVFVNQTLGEVFVEDGGSKVDEHVLYARREHYDYAVPKRARILTFSVDTQDNRLECKVMGWGPGEESWVIEKRVFMGSPAEEKLWNALDNYLLSSFEQEGKSLTLSGGMIDAGGHYSAQVYAFCKEREARNIYAIIGSNNPKADILDGDKRTNQGSGVKYFRIGVTACKDILYGRLKIEKKDPEEVNHGYIHFPDTLELEYFKQLLGEKPIITKTGVRRYEPVPGRRNEDMDLHNYNLATIRMLNPDWEAIEQGTAFDMGRKVYREYGHRNIDDSIVLDPNYPIIISWGFGKNPLVCVFLQTDGKRVWVFDELYVSGGDAVQMAREVMRRYGGHRRGFKVYGSAQGGIRSGAGKTEYAILSEYGLPKPYVRRLDAVPIDRVNAVNNMLEDMTGNVRLTIHPHCINLRRDFEQCLWLEDRSDIDRIDFGRGNAADALGHYVLYEWPLRAKRKQTKTHWK